MATIEELTAKVAELEQQMAAITAPPTEYYTSAYSGEEIDAAVKKVSEGLAGGVTSFNGRRGVVVPQAGDYNATQIPVSGGSRRRRPLRRLCPIRRPADMDWERQIRATLTMPIMR